MDQHSNPVRILHLTDPHLFADPQGSLRGTNTAQSLGAVLDQYLASDWAASAAIASGDLVQDDSKGAYERFRDSLERLQIPVYCVPGNHDVRELMQQTLDRTPFHYCATVELGSWTIISIDSCLAGSAGGYIAEAELARLESTLEQLTTPHALVCLHHPPILLGSRWLDGVGLQNGAELMARLSNHASVRAVLFGHAHQEYRGNHDGLDILGTPSTCRQFKPGSDAFAVDDLPPAYRKIELNADGSVESVVVWVGTIEAEGEDH